MDLTDDASHLTPPQELDLPPTPQDPLAPKADQTPTPSLEPPLRDSAPSTNSILGSPSKTRPSSVIATKNTRKRMEDRHVVLHDLKAYLPSALQNKIDPLEHVSFYAVFDGHAGTDAAAYAAAHLHELLVESPAYPGDLVQAFNEAFVTCDKNFVATSKKSGSTAVCALIKGDMLYTAWLGDSQATLVRNGVPIKIIDSHKPNRDDEKARIEGLGGSIMHWGTWRVNGTLAVSRAIGDGEYKPFISAEPDVTTIVMNGTEDFIIVGCDGLWDTITPEEATNIVFDHLEEKKAEGGDIENISARLATMAKEKGSGDNITIIVVFLKPVNEVIKLGKPSTRASGSVEADIVGITSTSDYVFSTGGRDSMEPSKDRPDFTSPNVSFTNPEGGGMFSPDPFGRAGSLGNGFNMSSENFDNNIEDKRFSNESERPSDEAFSNDNMAELLKKQSIDKVDDLLKMLDREDSSPTPDHEEEDARPLEEILAAAREQSEDQVDGVEDDDSSDDEIVELRRNGNSSSSSGNSQLEEVLKLDDRKLSDDVEDDSSSSTPVSNGGPVFPEPVMDPCEQVTVVATGPEECGTLVPPSQELPSHQEPVLEIVDTMTCSMVREEFTDQEGSNGAESNGVGDNVSFEGGDEEGFMLKTPGEEEQQLAEFSPVEHERETSVDTGESVDESQVPSAAEHPTSLEFSQPSLPVEDGSGGLGIPNVQITPATPTRSRSPVDKPAFPLGKEKETAQESEVANDLSAATVPSITTTEPTPEKRSAETPSISVEPPTPEQKQSKTAPKGQISVVKPGAPGKGTASRTPGRALPPATTKPGSAQVKSTTPKPAAVAAPKTGTTKPASAAPRPAGSRPSSSTSASSRTGPARPAPSTVSKPAGTRPASSTVGAAAARATKPAEKSGDAAKRQAKPAAATTQSNKITERKPLAAKPAENGSAKPTTKPTVPRTIPSKPKSAESKAVDTKTDPPKRPTSTTAPRPPATKSRVTPTVSRQPSNASSTSSAKPRSTVPKSMTATTSRLVSSKPTAGVAPKAPAAPKAASTSSKSSSGLSRSSSSATTRPSSSTASRAANSTTAVKPTAAAARVAAARAAAKVQKSGAAKAKGPLTSETVQTQKSTNITEKKAENGDAVELNGVSENTPEASVNAEGGDSIVPTEEVHETVNKNVVTGEEIPGSGENVTKDEPHLNGVTEVEQSEC